MFAGIEYNKNENPRIRNHTNHLVWFYVIYFVKANKKENFFLSFFYPIWTIHGTEQITDMNLQSVVKWLQ